MKKTVRSKHKAEFLRLRRLLNEFGEKEDPFSTFNEEELTIEDFDQFSQYVLEGAQIFNSLSFLVRKYSKNREKKNCRLETASKKKRKKKRVTFSLPNEPPTLPEPQLESQDDDIQDYELERPLLQTMMVNTLNKAMMTEKENPIEVQSFKNPKKEEEQVNIPLEGKIIGKAQDNELGSDLAIKATGRAAFMCYADKNSYLATVNHYGLTLKKDKDGIVSKHLKDELEYVTDLVYCKGAYFVFNSRGNRILKVPKGSPKPQTWWDKSYIHYFGNYNKMVRKTLDDSAIIVNLNMKELLVIQVRDNGKRGSEIRIKNRTRHRFNCHEPMLNNRVLTITWAGKLAIYEMDLRGFMWFKKLKTNHLREVPNRRENSFYMTVCERSEYCAILACDSQNTRASRIVIYKLKGEQGEDTLDLVTELDLWKQKLTFYHAICFSKYINGKLIICGQSSEKTTVHMYEFSPEKRRLVQRRSKSLGMARQCYKLCRNDQKEVYGMLQGGKILKFNFFVETAI